MAYKINKIVTAMLLLTSSVAIAQSNVTLYGVVDGAVSVTKAKGQAARVGFDNGIWAGSRFGIKGEEDLGSGNSIGFILEQGFKTFNGENAYKNKAFGRESLLRVRGNWGEVAAGRMGGLSSDCGSYSILHGSSLWTSYYSNGNIYGAFDLSTRMDNVLTYKTPNLNGSSVTLMYSNGYDGDENKWSKNSHYYGLGYEYAQGPALFSAIWEHYDNKEADTKSSDLFTIGGSYDFNFATLYGAYQYAHRAQQMPGDGLTGTETFVPGKENSWGLGKNGANQHAVSLSIGFPVMSGTLKFQSNYVIGKIKDLVAQQNKYQFWSVATAYEYPISKRTLMYAYAGYGSGSKIMKDLSSYNSWTTSIGLSHNF